MRRLAVLVSVTAAVFALVAAVAQAGWRVNVWYSLAPSQISMPHAHPCAGSYTLQGIYARGRISASGGTYRQLWRGRDAYGRHTAVQLYWTGTGRGHWILFDNVGRYTAELKYRGCLV